jgi:hypothetical protein
MEPLGAEIYDRLHAELEAKKSVTQATSRCFARNPGVMQRYCTIFAVARPCRFFLPTCWHVMRTSLFPGDEWRTYD